MKKHLSTILFVLVLVIGLFLLLYPTFSDWWNSFRSSRAIASYNEQVVAIDGDKYEEMWIDAEEYNRSLVERPFNFQLSDEQKAEYEALLNVGNNGIMGYIDIPSIDVTLPVYHGTGKSALQIAVGHLEWTSLPVGGESSHCVVSGHRGLPSAKLFTDLDQLEIGDVFLLQVLNEVLTYEIDQILIVEPDDTDELGIKEGEDLCTLVTCTPYGINSHRLLVRGHRIDSSEKVEVHRVTADAIQIDPIAVAPVVVLVLLLILFAVVFIPKPKRKPTDDEMFF